MTVGRTIALGLLVGIGAYLVLVLGMKISGIRMGELDQFPDYVGCLAKLEILDAESHETCGQLRSYFEGSDGEPWRIEQLAARAVAAYDHLRETAKNDLEEIDTVWVTPIARRLETAIEIIEDVFDF